MKKANIAKKVLGSIGIVGAVFLLQNSTTKTLAMKSSRNYSSISITKIWIENQIFSINRKSL